MKAVVMKAVVMKSAVVKCAARFVLVVCAACVCLGSKGAAAGALGIGGAPWSRPVDGSVVRAFDPPVTRFGPGHLGVDFAAVPGTPVRAAGDGIVVFAARIGSQLHVVVRHDGDLRTSYSFLASVDVVNGKHVERGAVVGTTGGTGPGHAATVVHFGLRVGATYVDPMVLFEPVDLAAVVHLAAPRYGAAAHPDDELVAVEERAAIVDAVKVDGRPPLAPPVWWGDARVQQPAPLGRGRSPARRTVTAAPDPPAATTTSPATVRKTPVALAAAGTTLVALGATRRRLRRRGFSGP